MKLLKSLKVRKFSQIWVGDFETTTTKSTWFLEHNQPRVIAWAVQELGNEDNTVLGVSMEEFELWFRSLKGNHQIYFHNLGKFDGWVLMSYALQHWNNEFCDNKSDIEFAYKFVNNTFLVFTIKTKGKTLTFYDSLKIFIYSLGKLATSVNLTKLTTDYNIEPVDRLEDLPVDYIEYLKQDVVILNRVLCQFEKDIKELQSHYEVDFNWNKATIASISRAFIRAFDTNNVYQITFKSQEHAADYYRGGFTNLNKSIEDRVINGSFTMIDAKSHYPSIMYLYQLPAYEPVFIDKKDIPNYKCVFVNVYGKIDKVLTNWGTIVQHDTFDSYITENNTDFEFFGTIEEWQIQEKFYSFKYWSFKEILGFKETQNILNPLIKDLYNLKETKEITLTYKTLINALYGSAGMKLNYPERLFCKEGEEPEMEIRQSKIGYLYGHKFSKQFYKGYEEYEYDTLYQAHHLCWNRWVAAYITSIGRYILMKNISLAPDKVYYCDTDSMIIDNTYPLEQIKLGKQMGDWDYDKKDIDQILVQGPKRYLLSRNGQTIKTSFAGVQASIWEDNFEDNVEIFELETISGGKRQVLISKEYNWFPLIIEKDYINHRKIELNRRKHGKEI